MDVNYLHESIRRGEIEIVRDLLEENPAGPGERYYNEQNVSAARAAIEGTSNRDEIYELLVSRGISLGPHEHMDEILPSYLGRVFEKDLTDRKEKLRQIHNKYLVDPKLKHILRLIDASYLSHDTNNEIHAYSSVIAKAFTELNDILELEPILKIASTAKGLKIFFDPTRNSVEHMDPTKSKFTFGTTYHNEAYIYIDAKGLICEAELGYARGNPRLDERNKVLGTLIHELSHLAMHLVYANDCKPYKTENSETIGKFIELTEICRGRQDQNEIIKRVFSCYSKERWHAELIVRAPHLYALYKDDQTKLSEVKKDFKELFRFYHRTIPDLKADYMKLNARFEIREINELCGTLAESEKSDISIDHSAINIDLDADDKVLRFSSNVVKMTMKTIYEELRNENKLENYIFVNMKTLFNKKIFDLILKASKLRTNPIIVIDWENAGESNLEVVANQLLNMGMNQRIIVVTDMERSDQLQSISSSTTKAVKNVPITHTWLQLRFDYQRKLLKREVIFQGKEISLEEIIDRNSIECLKYFPLSQLIEKKIIKIGNELPSLLDEVYIERKFLPPSTNPQTTTKSEYNVDEILQCVQSKKVILISDGPGMGKSTVLKVIANKCKDKFLKSWIVFIDLKQYYKTYQKDGQVTNKFSNHVEITKFFCENILKTNNFDGEVFTRLFNSDRVTILMDGFDEISPSFEEFILNLMKAIKNNPGNQLWISTRPHLVKELSEHLEPLSLEMRPFDEDDCEKLIERHLDSKKYRDEYYIRVYTIFYNFCDSKGLFSRESRISPLLLKMIIETIEDKGKIDKFVLNEYEIYDEFTKKQIKNSMEKGPDAKNDIASSWNDLSIIDFHTNIAFREIFQSDPVAEKMVETCFSGKSPAVEKAVRFGLMYYDGSKFFFIHRTYAEFFVAKYIYETIFEQEKRFIREDVEVTAEMLANILGYESYEYQMFFTFLEEALKLVSPDSYLKKNAELESILSAPFRRKFLVAGNYLNFEVLIKAECILLSVIFQVVPTEYLLQVFNRERIIKNLQYATERFSVDYFKKLWSLFNNKVGSERLQEIFFKKKRHDDNIFHTAIGYKRLDIFSFLLKKSLPISDEESDKHLLFACDERGRNILHLMLYHCRSEGDRLTKIKKSFASLNESQIQGQIKRLMLAQYRSEAGRSNILNPRFLFEIDSKNTSNAIEYFCKELNKMTTDEVAPLLQAIDEFGCNVLMHATRSLSINAVKALWDLIKEKLSAEVHTQMLLPPEEGDGKTVFHVAVESEDPEVFVFIKEIYAETFSNEILRKQVLTGINLLECVKFHHITISHLFHYLRETFTEESEFVNLFFQMTENSRRNPLKFCKLDSLKTLIHDARKTYTTDTFKQILLKKTAYDNKTIFHFALESRVTDVFTFIKNIYVETLSSEVLKEQVLTGINLIECTEYDSVIMSNLFHFLRETFTEESEFVNLFLSNTYFHDSESSNDLQPNVITKFDS